jgi:SAM-dependent methyltransferase
VSEQFGYDRGKPVDRRYIEQFLEQNRSDIAGRVLEIGDNAYTKQFGANGCHSEVFNRFADVEGTTYSGDLAGDHNLPADHLDCIIFTQTLHLIYDMPLAVETLWRALRPGGILLITVPWISPIDNGDWGATWYWSLSPAALRRLLGLRFGEENLAVRSFGNALAASAFLYGLAEHEIPARHLDYHDPNCPVIVAARAKKAG